MTLIFRTLALALREQLVKCMKDLLQQVCEKLLMEFLGKPVQLYDLLQFYTSLCQFSIQFMSSVSIFIFKGSDKVPATKRQRKQPSNVGVGRGAGGKKIKEAQGVQGASGGASTNVQVSYSPYAI